MTSLTPFVSRQDLSDVLGRDVTADDGALIAIDAACDMVRTMTEQDFNAQSGTATFDGTGTDTILLRQLPVSSIQSVTVGGTATSGTITGGSATTDWMLSGDGMLMRTAGAAWPSGRQNVQVIYSSGYGTSVLPRDVRAVALEVARRMVTQGNAMYETVGPVSIRYAVAATDFTAGEMRILRKYRR